MRKYRAIFLLPLVLLTACTMPEYNGMSDNSISPTESATEFTEEESSVPINYTEQKGLWLPFTEFDSYMNNETEFTEALRQKLQNAADQGINTIYFHAHPNGDAYYNSEIYPKGTLLGGDFDPLQIVVDEAHKLGISVHAWLNPYRMQTAEELEKLPESFIVKQWASANSPLVKLLGNRYYLNPAYDEVNKLISQTAAEILENYAVDGIHIDDYFYPTDDPDFDLAAFENSGSDDLAQWRRNNVSKMVKSLYDTVKSYGKDLKFGISPQGNIENDYNVQYADVELWTSESGYADYIVPQLYYGFENECCPFEPTLRQWEKLTENSDISLIIGLAEYKLGKYDKWAGVLGENEWIDDPDIIKKQINLVEDSSADGYALYREASD